MKKDDKNISLGLLLLSVSFLFGLVAFILSFFVSLGDATGGFSHITWGCSTYPSGDEFGYTATSLTILIGALFCLCFPLIALLAHFFLHNEKVKRVLIAFCGAFALAGGVLFFFGRNSFFAIMAYNECQRFGDSSLYSYIFENLKSVYASYSLSATAIVGGVFGILSGLAILATIYVGEIKIRLRK